MRVSAVCCVTAGDSAESKHRLWLFTPAYRRPRTAFGISCGQKPCTHSKLRAILRKYEKPPPAAQLLGGETI